MEQGWTNNYKIIIIGAGNVATHLGMALKNAGFSISQVFSRTQTSAKQLAEKLSAAYTTDFSEINTHGDIYFFMLADHALEEVLERINLSGKVIVHTSGSMPMDMLKKYSDKYGVLYPLQTFNKDVRLVFKEVPLFIESSDEGVFDLINKISSEISNHVNYADSEQRAYLHIAAVFACNFTNHMYSIAEGLLKEKKINFDFLVPLINQTTQKALNNSPSDVQTGPAVRNDRIIINKHKKLLSMDGDLQKMYSFVSEHIYKKYNDQGK